MNSVAKKQLGALSIAAMMVLGGCATNEGPEYDGNAYSQIKRYDIGVVVAERPVVVKDDGTGTFLGALIGAVLGSTLGGGDGRTLMALGGGLAGGYAGKEVGKSNAEELTVDLDNGGTVVIVVKGDDTYQVDDRIKIIKDGNKVASVQKLAPSQGPHQ